MNINSISTGYGYAEQSKKNDSSKDKTNNGVINSNNKYSGEEERQIGILKDKYSRLAEANKRRQNPRQYIFDKYYNQNSPSYMKGLTEQQRDYGYTTEMRMTFQGTMDYFFGDDALGSEPTIYDDIEQANKKLYNRQEVNNQLKSLFKDNNVIIPDNLKLTFKIDPYTYNLAVSGTEDSNLINTIEQLLNSGDNSKELFLHIIKSRSDDSEQCTQEKLEKYRLNLEIKKYTGYDLKDLKVANGKFTTEEGADIAGVYSEALKYNYSIAAKYKGDILAYYSTQLNSLAKNGFDSIQDLVLSIDYKNGSLYDVGQMYNFGEGKTQWIEKLKEKIV
ncbi:DUF4885 domain-containing protein [Clostridium cellulovorans]|uniref:DUF4885 domain-containing protein n=1 Tax=Clostridium cellulovorans (strain ATCC 35296 / DSM 3052 / OCM 3 / 743B) TaxID=573061 RepID=D9SVL4_CLOC7|nr:DUF4885 domain-containing protein [Clostridium cellulovorans]ADL51138.1 hypothetical protein Clocel_1385 [Clostridium cellulovorans 743B]